MEFWQYYRIVRRRRWLILATLVTAVIVVALIPGPQGSAFESTATLSISAPDQRMFLFVSREPRVPGVPDIQTALALELVRSRTVADRVVQRLNLSIHPAELQLRTRVEKDRVSDLVRVSVSADTPTQAVILSNAVAEAAATYHQEVNRREATLAREFTEKQIFETEESLRRAEDALLRFRQGSPMAGQLPAAANRMANLEGQAQQIDLNLSEIQARLASVRRLQSGVAATRSEQEIIANPIARQLRAELVQLEIALTSELANRTEQHSSVVALQAKIKAVKSRISTEVNRLVTTETVQSNPVYDVLMQNRVALETERIALQAKREAVRQAMLQASRDMPSAYQTELEHTRLMRSVDVLSVQYRDLQQRLGEVRLREQEAQHRGTLTLVDRAQTARPAPFRGKAFKFTLAALLGLMGGLGLTFFLEYLDNTVKTTRDAERLLGVPALVAIPKHNPPFDEAYRLLRLHLMRLSNGDSTRTYVLTSAKPGSGTSTVLANLARTFAEYGERTVILDAATHHPTQHTWFGITPVRGLTDVLQGRATLDDVLVSTRVPNLALVPAGDPLINVGTLLAGKSMDRVLAELQTRSDVILIDTGSAGVFADVYGVAPHTSGVVLVVGAGEAPRGIEQEVKLQLERVGARLLGVVLNRVKPELNDSYFLYERLNGNGGNGKKRSWKRPARKRAAAIRTG